MSAFDQAVAILHRVCQQHPDRPQYQTDLAKACHYLGRQYATDNKSDAASARYQQACRFQEQLLSSDPPGTIEARRDLALYYADLGSVQFDMNRFAESRACYAQAQHCLEPLAAEYPSDLEVQATLAIVYREIGMRRMSSDGVQWLNRSRSIFEAVVAVRPHESRYRIELAQLLTEIAKRESQPDRAVNCQRQAHDLWESLSQEFPSDPDIQLRTAWSFRDDARFLGFAGHHQEAIAALKRALDRIELVAPADAAEKYADFEVHVLSMLARSELRFDNAAEYRRRCQAILVRCRQRNCYAHDGLRVCVLLPDAVDDPEQLVDVAKDATSRGSPTLRKKANVGAALYRAGRYEEAIDVLTGVDKSNRLALFAHAGTAEVVRADNARVAVFLAMANARLRQSDVARDWLQKAQQWNKAEGGLLVASPAISADQAQPTPAASDTDPSENTTAAKATEPSNAIADSTNEPSPLLGLEDRILFADIVFEVQVLLNEAELQVDASAQ